MRILHFTTTLSCGGMERQLSYLAPALRELGHQVHVAYIRGGFFEEEMAARGVAMHHIRALNGFDPRIVAQILGLIKRIRPDLVQTWFRKMDFLAGPAAACMGIPWVLREPNSGARWRPYAFNNYLRRKAAAMASAIVSNSASGDAYWESCGSPAIRRVIKNALPFSEIRTELHAGMPAVPDWPYVLYAGRFDHSQKNFRVLLAAAEIFVSRSGNRHKFLMCGNGPERAAAEARIRSCGLEGKILLSSTVHRPWRLAAGAAAFVSASNFEGCPNSVLEAMAAGCPLALSDISEHREILGDDAAFYFDRSSPAAIADAAALAASGGSLPREKAAAAAKVAAAWNSPADTAREYDSLYAELLHGRR